MAVFRPTPPRPIVLAAAVALIVVALAAAALVRPRPSSGPRTLEIELTPNAGTAAQVYWSPDRAFSEERSLRVPFAPASSGMQVLRFPLPETPIAWLRIDPTDTAGEILIGSARVVDSGGRVEGTLNPDDFRPAEGIASITRIGDVTRIATTPGATDPYLFAGFGCVERAGTLDHLTHVTPASLTLVSAAFAVLLLACAALLGRAMLRGTARRTRWVAGAMLAGLFLIIFVAKLLVMHHYPMTVPYWDQWDGEARGVYVPFNDCTLRWPQMFALHNEHRIFFTRLLALDLLVLNGQWDPRLQQVVNAVMHACIGVCLAAILWVAGGKRWLALWACLCAVLLASPFSWDNTLMGFQSAFYLLLLFSIPALWLTTSYRAGSGPWVLGCLCAVAALFTSAGGVITIAAVLVVAVVKLAAHPRDWRPFLIALTCGAAMLWLGVRTLAPPLPGHEFLKAHTVAELLTALLRNLSWPWLSAPWLAMIVWLPVGLWMLTMVWRRGRTTELEWLNAGLTVWVLMNAAAIAYGRGVGGAGPVTRYMDFLSLGVVCNAAALVAIVDLARPRAIVKWTALGALAAWLVFAIVGVEQVTRRQFTELDTWRKYTAAHVVNVRRYVFTGDFAGLATKIGPNQIPYIDPAGLASALQDPYIRRILPAAIRPPLHVEPRAAATTGFITEGRSTRGIPRDPLQRQWLSLLDGRTGRGRFTSEHLACQVGGRLRFQVAGYLGWAHNSLAIRNLRTDERTDITPPEVPKENWTEVLVTCPPGLFEIVALDESPESWFGLREPIEVGWGSLAAEWLINAVS